MPTSKFLKWQQKHTHWNSWDDLSGREMFRLYSWLAQQPETALQAGAASNEPAQTVILTHVRPNGHAQGNMNDLQLVRRLVRSLGVQRVAWRCVVELLHHNPADPLSHGNQEHNHHAQLVMRMMQQETSQWGNVQCDVQLAETELEARSLCEEFVRSPVWGQCQQRIVMPVTAPLNPAHQHALRRGQAFHAYGTYHLARWPSPPQQHEIRHAAGFLRGGGLYTMKDEPISKPGLVQQLGLPHRAAGVKLWLFYIDDQPPTPSQLTAHAAGKGPHFSVPFTPAQGEPGDAMAHFISSFVLGAKTKKAALHVVLAPHLTAGAVHKPARNVTVMALKGGAHVQSLLRHCEDWVGVDSVHALAECCRAGKRLFFQCRERQDMRPWTQYHDSLAMFVKNGETDYRRMVGRASKAKLKQFGDSLPSVLRSLKV
jgi:hypothetical protein